MMKKAMMICVLTLMAVGAFSQERQKGHWTITPRVGITMPFFHGGYIGFEENTSATPATGTRWASGSAPRWRRRSSPS